MAYSRAEARFVTERVAEIDDAAAGLDLSRRTVLKDTEVLRARFGEFGRAATELAQCRRRLPGWLTDDESRQQATHPAVAAERARILAGAGARTVFDVTCSIGGEGRAVTAAGMRYVGSDLDHERLMLARRNVPEGFFLRADALHPPHSGGVVVADPARRAGGRRITDPARLIPPLPDLLEVHRGRELALKCAPGIDYSDWDGLVTVVSVDGAVKEACLYTPGFGRGRRAVAVTTAADGTVTSIDRIGSGADDEVAVGEPGRYILEPDGAVVRAGLVAHWANREGLWMLDSHIAFLTGEHIPAGSSGFEFIKAVPLKKLRTTLAAHDAGSVEILVRGVDVDPDRLRKKLKLRGARPMAVVIARVGDSARAHVCAGRVHCPP
ncbi:THUMP-like domain-containing protein [Corynebacterium frankenforstense]